MGAHRTHHTLLILDRSANDAASHTQGASSTNGEPGARRNVQGGHLSEARRHRSPARARTQPAWRTPTPTRATLYQPERANRADTHRHARADREWAHPYLTSTADLPIRSLCPRPS